MNRSQSPSADVRLPKAFHLLTALIAAYLAFCTAVLNEITAFVAVLLLVPFCLVLLRSRFLAVLVGLPALLGFFTYSSFIPTVTVIAPLFAIALGATAWLHKARLWGIFGWLAAGIAASLIRATALYAIPVIFFGICAAALALALAKGWRRTSTICAISALLLVGIVGLVFVLLRVSSLSLSDFIGQIRELMAESFLENAAMLEESIRVQMTRELFDGAFDEMLVTLPAVLLLSVSLFAFFAHLLALKICTLSGYIRKIPDIARIFLLSPVTAIVYIISFILMIAVPFVADDAAILSLTAQNLTLILTPPLAFVGWLGIYSFLAKTPGCLNIWILLGIVVVLFYTRGIGVYAMTFLGVYLTFRANKRRKADV